MRSFVKILVAILCFVSAFQSCHKEPLPVPAPSIEGKWKCLVCVNPDQTWSFENGTATQNYTAVGSTVWSNTFHYWVKSDTVNFVNLKTDAVSAWKVRFVGDGVCKVNAIGEMLNPIQYLERQ